MKKEKFILESSILMTGLLIGVTYWLVLFCAVIRMGINVRRLVVSEFSEKIVVSQTLKLYKKVLA
tara:strand:+ start:311 stop:505 length:195 start_codon:yes stop_codon:yes gene_type:complete